MPALQISALGGLDILVNCAGASQSAAHPSNNDPQAIDDLMWLNTLSVVATHSAAEDALLASKVSFKGREAQGTQVCDFALRLG